MLLSDLLEAQEDINEWRMLPPYARLTEQNLTKYINATITVKAHAWCMDNYIERAAMTSLVLKLIKGLDDTSRYLPH